MANSGFRKLANTLGNIVSWIVYLAGLLICLAALGVWTLQGYIWLKEARWLPLPISKYVAFDGIGWLGLDQLTTSLLNVNVGYPLLIAGIFLMALSLVRS